VLFGLAVQEWETDTTSYLFDPSGMSRDLVALAARQ
jgi:hypothetical protein